MKLKYDFVITEMANERVAVPVGKASTELHSVIRLNESASDIFALLQKGASEEEIINSLFDKYDTTKETLAEAVSALIFELREKGLINE